MFNITAARIIFKGERSFRIYFMFDKLFGDLQTLNVANLPPLNIWPQWIKYVRDKHSNLLS